MCPPSQTQWTLSPAGGVGGHILTDTRIGPTIQLELQIPALTLGHERLPQLRVGAACSGAGLGGERSQHVMTHKAPATWPLPCVL